MLTLNIRIRWKSRQLQIRPEGAERNFDGGQRGGVDRNCEKIRHASVKLQNKLSSFPLLGYYLNIPMM